MNPDTPPSDLADVLAANAAFYKAFQDLDMEAMCEVWRQDGESCCIHPGWAPLVGWSAVRQSFVAIFANSGWLRVVPRKVAVHLAGDLAWVRCIEVVSSLGDRGTAQGRVAATNLFSRVDGRWRMVLHHGSPIAVDLDD